MPHTLSLYEFSDRELLHRVNELADAEGWVTTAEVAEALHLTHPNPLQCIGTRFGWMRRYGILERDGARWRLTQVGDRIRRASLGARVTAAFDSVKPEEGMEAVIRLTTLYHSVRERPEGTLIRRAWRHGTGTRS